MECLKILSQRKNLIGGMLLIGILQAVIYYLAAVFVAGDGSVAIPQTDTLLYCQAARRICEGAPFSFSLGTGPSTGTTSVLYPFVLAVPYALGCVGDSLLKVGFALNALFFLVFLYGWGGVIDAKLDSPISRVLAAVLVALFGQTAYSAFAQSDIGFWLAVSSLFALGLARDLPWLYGAILLLAPWVRPEGMVCVVAFAMVSVSCMILPGRSFSKRDVVLSLLGIASVLGVFALNYALTGFPGFSSLDHKGHFSTFGFAHAVLATAADLMLLAKTLLFGIPDGIPRDLYFLPVIGALPLWCFILGRDWLRGTDRCEWVWIVAFSGGILTVAQSGWQNTNMDRYIGWLMPTVLIFAAAGVGCIAKRIASFKPAAILSILMGGFALVMAVVHVAIYARISEESDMLRRYAVEMESFLPKGKSLAAWGSCGAAYEMSPRKICHLSGIYSMEYRTVHPPTGVFEILKREPDKRFDYWFHNPFSKIGVEIDIAKELGHPVSTGPGGFQILEADWSALNRAANDPSPEAGRVLVARVDVGYDKDEKRFRYEVTPRFGVKPFAPFLASEELSGAKIVEAGRVIVGMDEMSVPLLVGKPVHVVMRTMASRDVEVAGCEGKGKVRYAFANPLKMNVMVDDEIVGEVSVNLPEKGFADVSFDLPLATVKSPNSRIAFLGDHIACCYWFYQ